MAWKDIKKITALIEAEKKRSKSNSAISLMNEAITKLYDAQEENDSFKEIYK